MEPCSHPNFRRQLYKGSELQRRHTWDESESFNGLCVSQRSGSAGETNDQTQGSRFAMMFKTGGTTSLVGTWDGGLQPLSVGTHNSLGSDANWCLAVLQALPSSHYYFDRACFWDTREASAPLPHAALKHIFILQLTGSWPRKKTHMNILSRS